MKISVAIMAHPKRVDAAKRLYNAINRQGFYSVSLVLDESNNEWGNGKRSLLAHTDSDWHIVLQDDAILCPNFHENVTQAIANVPEPTLISFYTGTVRPYPAKIDYALSAASKSGASWLQANKLLWGVGIAVSTKLIDPMLKSVEKSKLVYDERIGSYFKAAGKPVFYTNPSLVDHNYKLGSLIGNDRSEQPRVARNFLKEGYVYFNSKTEEIFR